MYYIYTINTNTYINSKVPKIPVRITPQYEMGTGIHSNISNEIVDKCKELEQDTNEESKELRPIKQTSVTYMTSKIIQKTILKKAKTIVLIIH